MQDLPHHYSVGAQAAPDGDVALTAENLPILRTDSPAEFGGPGNRWSPETLLVGAVADCFILTFRAVARASKLPWISLTCEVDGILDRIERAIQFTEITVHAKLTVPEGVDESHARRLLEKAEHGCLITNSLKAASHLQATVEIGRPSPAVNG